MSTLMLVDEYYYGGGDGNAINRHHTKVFKNPLSRTEYHLDKNLSICPPAYELTRLPHPKYQGIMPIVKIDGSRFFCDGESWSKAISKMAEALEAEVVLKPRS